MSTLPQKDPQRVTVTGESVQDMIDGVKVRYAVTQLDERGSLCEIFNPAWDFSQEPLVYAYEIGIRPGRIKGWSMHLEQNDRLYISLGTLLIVLYDDRAASPTHGMVNAFCLSELRRGLVYIPKGVYHAVQNVGTTDALLINLPTRPYDHNNPDKFRLPINNDLIPYHFETGTGW